MGHTDEGRGLSLKHVHSIANIISDVSDRLTASCDKNEWSILDIGAETGEIGKVLRVRGYGGEFSAVYFVQTQTDQRENQRHYNISLNYTSANSKPIPIGDEYFDLVIVGEALLSSELFKRDVTKNNRTTSLDPQRPSCVTRRRGFKASCLFICHEAMRVTRPNGYFIVVHETVDSCTDIFDEIVSTMVKEKQIKQFESQLFLLTDADETEIKVPVRLIMARKL